MISNRRAFLFGSAALLAMPAIVRVESLMHIVPVHRLSDQQMIDRILAEMHAFDVSPEGAAEAMRIMNPTLERARGPIGSPHAGFYDGYEQIILDA